MTDIIIMSVQCDPASDDLRNKLIADLSGLPVWHRGTERVVTPNWWKLSVAERDLLVEALAQWRPTA